MGGWFNNETATTSHMMGHNGWMTGELGDICVGVWVWVCVCVCVYT